ncbi:MAG TPA: A24 family peptidase [Lachnospiraceae bacterium]|nr:A24 family peptidase [Lachnospiraceae bacterium]
MDKEGSYIIIFICLLFMACYFDYCQNRIPNGLIFVSLVGFLYFNLKKLNLLGLQNEQTQEFFTKHTLDLLLFSTIIFLVLYLFYKLGMLGAGDVKLYTVASLYLAPNQFWCFLLCSLIIAAVIGVIRLVRLNNLRERIAYFCAYIVEVVHSGKFFLYLSNKTEQRRASVHLAGPMLVGGILCIFITK